MYVDGRYDNVDDKYYLKDGNEVTVWSNGELIAQTLLERLNPIHRRAQCRERELRYHTSRFQRYRRHIVHNTRCNRYALTLPAVM